MNLEDLDEGRYHARLKQAGGLALVLFGSPQCGACRAAEKRLPHAAPAQTRLFKVNVQQATGLARAFDLFHLPALFLYRDGEFHAALACEISERALAEAMARALALPAEEEP